MRSINLIIIDFKYDREIGWHSKGLPSNLKCSLVSLKKKTKQQQQEHKPHSFHLPHLRIAKIFYSVSRAHSGALLRHELDLYTTQLKT